MSKSSEAFKTFISSIAPIKFTGDLEKTPARVEAAYKEFLSGYLSPPPVMATFKKRVDQLVVVQDVPFFSLCEHHALPFFGKAHFGYLPANKVLGLSKFSRALEHFSHRLQIQEGLTEELADFLQKHLRARFLIVVIEAQHLCMVARGAKAPGATMKTSAIRGSYNATIKAEFFSILSG